MGINISKYISPFHSIQNNMWFLRRLLFGAGDAGCSRCCADTGVCVVVSGYGCDTFFLCVCVWVCVCVVCVLIGTFVCESPSSPFLSLSPFCKTIEYATSNYDTCDAEGEQNQIYDRRR